MAYRSILCCIDNSADAEAAVDLAGAIARPVGATVTAVHVYAARLHDRRFADLEPSLPAEHRQPERLERSRRTHDTLIGHGLRLISDAYVTAARARLHGCTVHGKSVEGTHYVELAREAATGDYDLAVIGATGLGLAALEGGPPPGAIGSVCARFVRRTPTDVLVARGARPIGGTIVVGVDGSPAGYGALRRALGLAERLGARVHVCACFDPGYHPVAFEALADVLSEADAKVFRFREQEALHDAIIDRGLANLYQGYLDNAAFVATGRGRPITTELVTGKPAFALARAATAADASLVVCGRFGAHRTADLDLGATAEGVVHAAACHVLLVNDPVDDTVCTWTAEAEARLAPIPEFMRPMVRRAVEVHARARGLTTITAQLVTDAKQHHGVRLPGHHPGDPNG